MKKLTTLILAFFLATTTASATVPGTEREILWSIGTSELEIGLQRGEVPVIPIKLSGSNLSEKLKVFGEEVSLQNSSEAYLYPGDPKMESYDFWHIKGLYGKTPFLIVGYTTTYENHSRPSMLFYLSKWFVLYALITVGFFISRKIYKKRKSNATLKP